MRLSPLISDGVPESNGEVSQQHGANEGFRHEHGVAEGFEIKCGSPLAIRNRVWDGSVDGPMASMPNAVHHPSNLGVDFAVRPSD